MLVPCEHVVPVVSLNSIRSYSPAVGQLEPEPLVVIDARSLEVLEPALIPPRQGDELFFGILHEVRLKSLSLHEQPDQAREEALRPSRLIYTSASHQIVDSLLEQ